MTVGTETPLISISSSPSPSTSVSSSSSAFRDIVFGSIAGVCGKIIEFPADTVKVKLQSQSISSDGSTKQFHGAIDCFRKTFHREGVRGFYRGLSSPLVGAVLENATLFVSYNAIQSMIRGPSSDNNDTPLSLPQLFFAGGLAGTAASFLLTPVELIKCKLQVMDMANSSTSFDSSNKFNRSFHASHESSSYRHQRMDTHAMTQRRFYTPPPSVSKKTMSSAVTTDISMYSSSPISIHSDSSIVHSESVSTTKLCSSKAVAARMAIRAMSSPHLLSLSASVNSITTPTSSGCFITYSGPIDVIRRTMSTYGIRGLYRGHLATMIRETGGSAAWFGVYEVAIRNLISWRESSSSHHHDSRHRSFTKNDLNTSDLLLAGALAGISYNLILFPADVIKSRMQTDDELKSLHSNNNQNNHNHTNKQINLTSPGFWRVGCNLYHVEGIRGLYRGCLVTVVKSTPTSAVIFGVYEWLNRHI